MSQPQEQMDVETVEVDSYKTQHAKVLRFEISVGKDDDGKTLEQFEEDLREALAYARDHGASVYTDASRSLNFHNLTTQGGYYIIDGTVCLTRDYDPATKNRKPGTFAPMWAGGPDPKKVQLPIALAVTDDEEDGDTDDVKREFVMVKPTIQPRDPVTGRRPRKDKGVKRGPRKETADKLDIKAKVAELGEQMKEAQS
jgi:hypothetical protein